MKPAKPVSDVKMKKQQYNSKVSLFERREGRRPDCSEQGLGVESVGVEAVGVNAVEQRPWSRCY